MRFLPFVLATIALAGCCSQPAPEAPGATALEPVIAQPVRGVCIPIPFVGCKICLGVSCDVPPLIEPAVFGTPVQREAPAAAPCAPVYDAPCGSCSDGAGDVEFDYGMPPR